MLVEWIIGLLVALVVVSLVLGFWSKRRMFFWIAVAAGVVLIGLYVLVAIALTAL